MKVFTLLLAVFAWSTSATWAQTTGDKYSIYDGATATTTITHKHPKWTQYRQADKDYKDTYDEEDMVTLENGAVVQAANVYVDTIYVHKGTTTSFTLPYRVSNNNASIYDYLRYFNYRTDGSYRCEWTPSGSADTVYDLLTPGTMNTRTRPIYRFANGYVVNNPGSGYVQNVMDFYYPSDEEFESIGSTIGQADNDYYIVACDASIYTDFKKDNDGTKADFGEENDWCEPTLAGRALYYIIGVEDNETHRPSAFTHYWSLLREEYQGGTNDGTELYVDEFEITYPTRRFSSNTAEMVALTKDARAYAIPGTNPNDDPGELTVTLIDENDNGFHLTFTTASQTSGPEDCGTSSTISGDDRVIFFFKGTLGGVYSSTAAENVPTDTQWSVNDGDAITILVTKTINNVVYNLARYKVTFRDNASLLTQTQVAGLDKLTGEETYWWKDMTHRSPEYVANNCTQVASLTFDYDESVTAENVLPSGQNHFYPFPKGWTTTSYAFFDGVTSSSGDALTGFDTWVSQDNETLYVGTRFSMYSITNEYIGYWDRPSRTAARPPANTGKDDSGYWLYIDASERPGSVAELTFDGGLCPGSILTATAWIKGTGSSTSVDAGALLSFIGVTKNDDGTETHTTIYRQASGQVRCTNLLDSEDGLASSITGKGSDTNEWFQIYFTFVNSNNYNFDYYTLRVDNYCAGTDGGDYYFDEVRVYLTQPNLEMTQLEAICTEDEETSLMRMDLDYETMMSRLGYNSENYANDESGKTASVDFVIFNKAKFYNSLADIDHEPTLDDYKEIFDASLVTFYGKNGSETKFPTLDFYFNYSWNTPYDETLVGTNQVNFSSNSDDRSFYRRTNDMGADELSIDFISDMRAYTAYDILLEPHIDEDRTDDEKIEEFVELLNSPCAITTEFYLTATTLLKLNGEMVDPTADYCAGQEFVISPEVTYTDEDTGEVYYIDGVYFDWFFGSVEEYTDENEEFGNVTLKDALIVFRMYYPDAEELSMTDTPPTGEGDFAFAQYHYNIIAYYLTLTRSGGVNNMLVLHKSHLDMRVLTAGLDLVIQPILTTVEINGEVALVCFGYVPISLMASGDAPTLKMGNSNINYLDNDYEPCLRLGLAQFNKCDQSTPFTINLHDATYIEEADDNGQTLTIDHLGVAEGMDVLFLVDSDDPAYRETLLEKENDYEIVVGKITRLYATNNNDSDPRSDTPTEAQGIGSYMQIYFFGQDDSEEGWNLTPLTVREGYYYVLSVYFQEKGPFDEGEQAIGTACWGTFPLEMKVVPEYLVWQGDKDDNWNNDNHWRRADKEELNKPATDTYPTNEENGTDNGYVPMLFSKVIIPKNSVAELYMAGFKEDSDEMLSWEGDEDTSNHDNVSEHPTGNIMFDQMLYEYPTGTLKTEHYRVNLCRQLHLSPGAQMLHSELLLVDTVWTEVKIPQGVWQLVATPLNSVYSGDWYTKSATGTETAEYFTDITFNSSDNDRYDPDVYQRSWDEAGTIVASNSNDNRTTPAYESTGWTSAYNDASVLYSPGVGFSLEGWSSNSTDSIMFRFPKADTSYDYSTGTLGANHGTGTLLISSLVDRTDPDKDGDDVYKEGGITVTLPVNELTDNNYYLIGNPFTAPMSMAQFMAANTDIYGYWTESEDGPVAGDKEKNSWGTEDVLIAPYTAFFVTTSDSDISPLADEPLTVSFTKDMQTMSLEEDNKNAPAKFFAIRATNSVGTTGASLSYNDSATDGYDAREDVILLEDNSWKRDGMPMVYTVAGDMAVSINTLSTATTIPIGAFADDDCAYTLTFVGTDNLIEPVLYDAYALTETPLTEGFTLDVTGASHGQYFIRVAAPTPTGITEDYTPVYDITAYSPTQGTIIVSSSAELENVDVYSVGGMLLRQVNAGGNISCTINGINSGVAIVRARTSEGIFIKKLRVR